MITDAEIAVLSPEERRDLIRRLARPVEEIVPSQRWLRRTRDVWVALTVTSAVVLVPWVVYLALTLPREYAAQNWDRTWVGFDLLLVAMLAATAVLGWLRRQLVVLTSFTTGVLLVCDAWFDVMTAHGDDRVWSVVTALLVELPLAAVLVLAATRVLRLSAARLWADGGVRAWDLRIPLATGDDPAVRRRTRQQPRHQSRQRERSAR
ncbi:hypothetical protein SAMN04488570_0027 [Nocardioides scoriae]|uniref:Uncharacterized protein n=1 Tax=Nocardioides scoriae TaxID=642780 RepID=A0A1H1L3F8_9ACTN|nr:hypothetical protein [Nocardioides scoriae]SDR69023.1 hypothetical protein SAMN04488570_0027 [Nocardioides scoriae]